MDAPIGTTAIDNSHDLQSIAHAIHARMDGRYGAREEALALCRQATRNSANAIRALHREEFDHARTLITTVGQMLARAGNALAEHQDVFYAGFVHDAQKEYAEACLTLALVTGSALPTPEELAVEDAAYLNGMGEAVGELRRHLLDKLRAGEFARCEAVLSAMDEIFNLLVTMDYPDAITAGLRRTTDSVRGILERTRGDFSTAFLQNQLAERLHNASDSMPPR